MTNIVRLQQKFHSQSVSEVKTRLLMVPCVFCQHPLQHHSSKYITDHPMDICVYTVNSYCSIEHNTHVLSVMN